MLWEELKNKSKQELKELLDETRAQLHSLSLQARARELKQVHKISDLKKTAARVLTLLRQRELEEKKSV
jgi:large subunit ribosomal protein L29